MSSKSFNARHGLSVGGPTPIEIVDATGNILGGTRISWLLNPTVTSNLPLFNTTQTWNNSAVVFDALKINITDSASDASSKLADLQVGGVSKFSVDKNGNTTVAGDLTVLGTTVTMNTTVMDVEDTNITLGKVATPTNATANGGGITLLGGAGGDKTLTWDLTNSNWTSNQSFNLSTTSEKFKIANVVVLDSTTVYANKLKASSVIGPIYYSDTLGTYTSAATLSVPMGGTGFGSYAIGDLLYANTTTSLAKLADVAVGSVLVSGGVGVAPSWSTSPILTQLTAPTLYGSSVASGTLALSSTSNATKGTLTVGDSNLGILTLQGFGINFKLGAAASAGFLKVAATTGEVSIDTNTYLTGNQSITLSGDVTGSGATAITTTIANNAVTLAKFQQVNTATILGRNTAALGNIEVLTAVPSAVLGASTLYVGTTAITLNRASAGQALTGITSIDGSAASLTTARSISMTGDVSWTVSFNGIGNVTAAGTLANVATAGTYRSVTINAKGLVTGGTNPTTLAGYGITDTISISGFSTTTAALGTSSAGVATTVARGDHVHQLPSLATLGAESPLTFSTGLTRTTNTVTVNYGTTAGTACQGNDARLSDARIPTSHAHGNITNTGYLGTTANIPLITGTSGIIQAGSFGTTLGTFCQGNDARLSDARTPLAHTHTFGTTAGTFCEGNDARLSDARTPLAHTHTFGTTAGTFCEGNDARLSDARPANGGTATKLVANRTTWVTDGSKGNVAGELAWVNFGNSHTIIDMSSGVTPSGAVKSNTNSEVAWVATYPTLMGWNGTSTYGVRVDSARVADSARYADLAEKYTMDKVYPCGTVVVISDSDVSECVESFEVSQFAAGIITTKPAFVMNAEIEGQAIALTGRVPVRVIGLVKKGQLLVSNVGGTAVVGTVNPIAIALESKTYPEEGLIECKVL